MGVTVSTRVNELKRGKQFPEQKYPTLQKSIHTYQWYSKNIFSAQSQSCMAAVHHIIIYASHFTHSSKTWCSHLMWILCRHL